MSTVIEFRPPIARGAARVVGPSAGVFIIFPGVRRERHGDGESDVETCEAASKPKRQSRSRPKRDRIELPD